MFLAREDFCFAQEDFSFAQEIVVFGQKDFVFGQKALLVQNQCFSNADGPETGKAQVGPVQSLLVCWDRAATQDSKLPNGHGSARAQAQGLLVCWARAQGP